MKENNKEKIAILTDTGCNVKENKAKNIFVVPLYITYKNMSKKDTVEITSQEIYEKMDQIQFKTAAPSVDDFLEKIRYIDSLGYNRIIGISLSSKFSGTFNSMRIALEKSEIKSEILDSKYASVGSGLLVNYGSKLIEEGVSFKDITKVLKKKRSDIKIYAVIKDLKYLIRGGRISSIKGNIGTLLRITPILKIAEDGEIVKIKSVRGVDKAIKYMTELAEDELNQQEKDYYMALSYAKDKKDIDKIKSSLEKFIKNARFYLEEPLTSVLGTHTGPDISVVSYLPI